MAKGRGLVLVFDQRRPLRRQGFALDAECRGFFGLHRAENLQLVVQMFKLHRLFGSEIIHLLLHLQRALTQGREQIVVGIDGDLLPNFIQLVAQGIQVRRFDLIRRGTDIGAHRRCRAGRLGVDRQGDAQQYQGEQAGGQAVEHGGSLLGV